MGKNVKGRKRTAQEEVLSPLSPTLKKPKTKNSSRGALVEECRSEVKRKEKQSIQRVISTKSISRKSDKLPPPVNLPTIESENKNISPVKKDVFPPTLHQSFQMTMNDHCAPEVVNFESTRILTQCKILSYPLFFVLCIFFSPLYIPGECARMSAFPDFGNPFFGNAKADVLTSVLKLISSATFVLSTLIVVFYVVHSKSLDIFMLLLQVLGPLLFTILCVIILSNGSNSNTQWLIFVTTPIVFIYFVWFHLFFKSHLNSGSRCSYRY